MRERFTHSSAKRLPEDALHLIKSIFSTTTPNRSKEDAFEKHIVGKWHVIALQEAIEYVDHELLTNRFHLTHQGGCAVLFNEDTFFRDIKVKSIYLHDIRHDLPDKVFE